MTPNNLIKLSENSTHLQYCMMLSWCCDAKSTPSTTSSSSPWQFITKMKRLWDSFIGNFRVSIFSVKVWGCLAQITHLTLHCDLVDNCTFMMHRRILPWTDEAPQLNALISKVRITYNRWINWEHILAHDSRGIQTSCCRQYPSTLFELRIKKGSAEGWNLRANKKHWRRVPSSTQNPFSVVWKDEMHTMQQQDKAQGMMGREHN